MLRVTAMLRKEYQGVIWFEFELLEEFKNLRHGTFTRHGGVSSGLYASLNVGFGVGDEVDHVKANRKKVISSLSREQKLPALVTGTQVHGDMVHKVIIPEDYEAADVDSLITEIPEVALMIKHADCQAAIFYDPVVKALGCAHAGWKGSTLNIYKKEILSMEKAFGCKPENLLVAISPSLGPDSSEFKNYKEELPQTFWDFQVKPLYFDFWKISKWQLEEAGILPSHIQIAQMDTYTNEKDFFSFRRNNRTGRQATVAFLTQ
jgi:polyphenol oxidase